MNQNEWYLAHHGILGMHWGKKNGPPYPLDYNKLSAEEKTKAKESAISRGDVKEAYNNKEHFSVQEINDLIRRYETDKKLSELNAKTVKTGKKKVESYLSMMNTTARIFNETRNAIKAINDFSKMLEDKDSSKKKEEEAKVNTNTVYNKNGKKQSYSKTIMENGNRYTVTRNYM